MDKEQKLVQILPNILLIDSLQSDSFLKMLTTGKYLLLVLSNNQYIINIYILFLFFKVCIK